MADQYMRSPGVAIGGNISFNGTTAVVGAGSTFLSTFLPGDIIAYFLAGAAGNKYYNRVLSVADDFNLTLVAAAPSTRLNITAYLVPRTAQVTGVDGHLYNLAPPAVGQTTADTWTGTLLVPSAATAAAALASAIPGGLNANWIVGVAPPAPPAPPAIPAAATLMSPPGGQELDTFVVTGQTDGHVYSVTAYDTGGAVYRQTVPPQAVNPLISDGWTVV